MVDAVRRGVNRNWYLDELDWIRSREFDDADEAPAVPLGGGNNDGGAGVDAFSSFGVGAGSGAMMKKQKDVFVKAPADAAVTRHACPICQEEFGAVWHDGAQEWVWMDAVRVGGEVEGRTYHQSCLEELEKDKGGVGAVKVKSKVGGVKREG